MECVIALSWVIAVWNVFSMTTAALAVLDFPGAIWAGCISLLHGRTNPWPVSSSCPRQWGPEDGKYALLCRHRARWNLNWSGQQEGMRETAPAAPHCSILRTFQNLERGKENIRPLQIRQSALCLGCINKLFYSLLRSMLSGNAVRWLWTMVHSI